MIWEPQLVNKMGKFAAEMSLVFFWARIFKRTKNLSYPEGGYGSFADKIVASFIAHGGDVQYNTEILSLQKAKAGKVSVQTGKESFLFDKVIVTTPSSLFCKMAPQLPDSYKQKLEKLRSIGATDLVLRLKKPLLLDKTYWLSICKKNAPIMVVVEHTNLISPSYYNNEHIVYLGNYLERTSKAYSMTKEEKLRLFDPFLKQINPDYRKNLIGYDLFKAPFAQPIVTTNYSRKIPSMQTPMSNVYLANIDQVYPWDRGTNYAIELGNKVAKLI
jgi:protoporphyrinogen oxidase